MENCRGVKKGRSYILKDLVNFIDGAGKKAAKDKCVVKIGIIYF